jgi:hypothetical protein
VYLFTDRVSEAKDIHSQYKMQNITSNVSWVNQTKSDFSDFEKVKQPQEIKGVTRLLKNIVRVGGSEIVILTARAAYKPIKDYLSDIGLDKLFVVALADSDPQKKADWIENKIKDGVKDVFFIDDSHKNVAAVKALSKKYPNISLKVRHVQHDIPAPPKQSDMKSQKDKEDTKKVEPKKNDMSLKSLLPKDLDKKIKNPDTGKMIKLKTALGYEKDTKAYKAAQFTLKKK